MKKLLFLFVLISYGVSAQIHTKTPPFNDAAIQAELNTKINYTDSSGSGHIYITKGQADSMRARINSNIATKITGTVVALASDKSTTSTSYVDIAGLSSSLTGSQMYYFKIVIPFNYTNTAKGSLFSVNGGATATYLAYRLIYPTTTTAFITKEALTAFDNPSGTGIPASTAATSGNIAIIEGFVTLSSTSTFSVRYAAASAETLTVKAGAVMILQPL